MLEKIDIRKESEMTYVAGNHTFNYLVRDEVIYLCLADKDMASNITFAFLKKIVGQFKSMFGNRGKSTSAPYAFNGDFVPVLRKTMEMYSNPDNAKLLEVKSGLDEVKGIVQQNIADIIESGEQLDSLLSTSENLIDSSSKFSATATQLRKNVWWNDMKVKLAGAGCVAMVLFGLSASACGGLKFPDCT